VIPVPSKPEKNKSPTAKPTDDKTPAPTQDDTRASVDPAARSRAVWKLLEQVNDPEIPTVSVVELGMIAGVSFTDSGVSVALTPTFAACPAISVLQDHIRTVLTDAGYQPVEVRLVFDPPWNTDRITPAGLEKLKAFGLAVPERRKGAPVTADDFHAVPCPYCNSTDTTVESMFGPTLCRAIHYCNDCRQSFEHFKPLT